MRGARGNSSESVWHVAQSDAISQEHLADHTHIPLGHSSQTGQLNYSTKQRLHLAITIQTERCIIHSRKDSICVLSGHKSTSVFLFILKGTIYSSDSFGGWILGGILVPHGIMLTLNIPLYQQEMSWQDLISAITAFYGAS